MDLDETDKRLVKEAFAQLNKTKGKINNHKYSAVVASALLAENDKVYTGINIEFYCGEGVCAERNTIPLMAKDGITKIKKIVAVSESGVTPPCGVCREVMFQINDANLDTEIIVSDKEKVLLRDLLPMRWQDYFGNLD